MKIDVETGFVLMICLDTLLFILTLLTNSFILALIGICVFLPATIIIPALLPTEPTQLDRIEEEIKKLGDN